LKPRRRKVGKTGLPVCAEDFEEPSGKAGTVRGSGRRDGLGTAQRQEIDPRD
jgi:hypothetical protein